MSETIIIAGVAFRTVNNGTYVSLTNQWVLWLDMSDTRHPWRVSFEGRMSRRRYDTPHVAIHKHRARIKDARDHRAAKCDSGSCLA